MDSNYISIIGADDFNRKAYFTIINAATTEKVSMRREFSALDVYPTTLAALGATIEGDRLGLGVNLFSSEPTLCELWDMDALNIELMKDSQYYRKNLLEQ